MTQIKLGKTQKYFDELNMILAQEPMLPGKAKKRVAKVLGITPAAVNNWFSRVDSMIPSYENSYLLNKFYSADVDILRLKK